MQERTRDVRLSPHLALRGAEMCPGRDRRKGSNANLRPLLEHWEAHSNHRTSRFFSAPEDTTVQPELTSGASPVTDAQHQGRSHGEQHGPQTHSARTRARGQQQLIGPTCPDGPRAVSPGPERHNRVPHVTAGGTSGTSIRGTSSRPPGHREDGGGTWQQRRVRRRRPPGRLGQNANSGQGDEGSRRFPGDRASGADLASMNANREQGPPPRPAV